MVTELAEVDAAVKANKDIVFFCYTPHHMFALHKLVVLEEPEHDSANWNVIQPTDGIVAIGSGGNYALAAAKALVQHSELDAATIVQTALSIAASIDIYTNTNIVVEELECKS